MTLKSHIRKLRLSGSAVALSLLLANSEAGAADFFKNPGQWFNDTGKAVNQTVINGGKAIEQGARDAGKAVEKGIGDAGHAIETGAHDAGHAIEKGVGDGGHAIENAAHDTGHFIEKHPWEVIGAAAFMFGGYYLIMYENYTLAISIGSKTIPLIQGGAWVGGTSIGLGGGTLAYAALTPSSGTEQYSKPQNGSGSTVIATRVDVPRTPSTAVAAPAWDRPVSSKAPTLSFAPYNHRTPADARFQYAFDVLRWVDSQKLAQNFDPKSYPDRLSPGEEKILDALKELSDVPDSKADALALEQAKRRDDLPRKLYWDACMDVIKLKDPATIAYNALKSIFKVVIEPTQVGDGTREARVHTAEELTDRLAPFLNKRFGIDKQPMVVIEPLVNGPELKKESMLLPRQP
jgi:hypothetical protein